MDRALICISGPTGIAIGTTDTATDMMGTMPMAAIADAAP
jgi:hypothetical protein